MKNRNKVLLVILILMAISSCMVISYSFYSANVKSIDQTQTILRAKKLNLIFADTKELHVTDMIPGMSVTKTFEVISDSDEQLVYNIKYRNITNTFNREVVYTLTRDGQTVISQTILPKTKSIEYLLTGIDISPGERHNYVLTVTYLYDKDEYQELDPTNEFLGTLEIDLDEKDKSVILTKEFKDINDNEKEYIIDVRNSSMEALDYNVYLSNLVNNYTGDNLTYTLYKNGAVFKSGTFPKPGELNYFIIDQEIASGNTDVYRLNIKGFNSENASFDTEISTDMRDNIDTTPAIGSFALASKTSKSITYNASCADNESGIKSYKFYLDGILLNTYTTDQDLVEYTYSDITDVEHTFKLVCTNGFNVETKFEDKNYPTSLQEPTYNVDPGYATSKDVDITYAGEGNYLLSVTGTVISNIDLYACDTYGENCEENPVVAGTNLTENTWYKVGPTVKLTFDSNGSAIAKVTDGINVKQSSSIDINSVDKTEPEASIATKEKTSNSVTVTAICNDDESGISAYKFYLDGELKKTIDNITEESYEYTYKNINNVQHTYKLECVNGASVSKNDEVNETTPSLEMPTYEIDAGYAQSKNVKINYSGQGSYLLKITGKVKATEELVICSANNDSAEYSCTEDLLAIGQELIEGTWYRVSGTTTLIFNTNGSIIAKVTDGTNYKEASTIDVNGVDTENPVIGSITATLGDESGASHSNDTWTNQKVYVKVNATDNGEIDTYEYKLNDGVWRPMTSESITFEDEMDQTIAFRVKDKAGNYSSESTYTIKIDKTNPIVTFGENGNTEYEKSHSTTVTVNDTFSQVNESSLKYEWTTSTTAPETYTNSFTNGDTISTPTDVTGTYYLWIYAEDNAGNPLEDGKNHSNLFQLDNTLPTCEISGNPTSWVQNATLTVTGSDNITLASLPYSWDGAAYSNTTSKDISTSGTYTVNIKDKAGNIGSCSADVTRIDTTGPDVNLETKEKTSNSITVTASCSDDGAPIQTYEFYKNGTKVETYTTANTTQDHTYNNLASGTYTLKVVCTNASAVPNEKGISESTSDLKEPTYTVPSGYAKSKSVVVDYHSSEGVYLFKVTGTVTSNTNVTSCTSTSGDYNCTSGTTVTAGNNLTENTWYKTDTNPTLTFTSAGSIIAKTVDGTNYKSGSSADISGIENDPPTLSVSVANGTTYAKSKTATVTLADSGSGLAGTAVNIYYAWGTSAQACSSMTSKITITPTAGAASATGNITIDTESGNGSIYVCNKDAAISDVATNTLARGTTTSATMYLDNTPPSITFGTDGNSTAAKKQTSTIVVNKNDSLSDLNTQTYKYVWSTSNATSQSLTEPYASGTSYSKDGVSGTYYIIAKACDKLNNCTTKASNAFKLDNTGPTITFGTNGNSTYKKSQSSTITVTNDSYGAALSTGTYKYMWSTDNATSQTPTTSFTSGTSYSKDSVSGTYYIVAKACDALNNCTTKASNAFKLDNTGPTCGTISGNPTSWVNSATLSMSGSKDCDTSGQCAGLNSTPYSWDAGVNWSSSSSKTVDENGTYAIRVRDTLGNYTSCSVTVSYVYYKAVNVTYTNNGQSNVQGALDKLYETLK